LCTGRADPINGFILGSRDEYQMNTQRRAFLSSAVAAGGAVLAGCLGSGGETTGGSAGDTAAGDSTTADVSTRTGRSDGTTAEPSDDPVAGTDAATASAGTDLTPSLADSAATDATATDAAGAAVTASLDHPAATALGTQPFLGPAPDGTGALMIAFEDPSCYNCERFNANTFPKLESGPIADGELTYVYRNFPYAFPWGEPAMQALEATLARSEPAHWALKAHYFAEQSKFGGENVLDRTEEFLTSETDVDAAAVVADAETTSFAEAVRTDVDAGEAAGVVSTPTFYLFDDGQFLTEVRGAQSYDVFASALGL
jgi:protein-disulfide isomerase